MRPRLAGGMEATLRIRLFGELDLRLGEVALPALDSARAESLLAYLLLHRDAPQPRQRLAFLLWPDSSEPQARTNLRHVLHKLRRGLPQSDRFLEVTPRTLRWRPDAPYTLDVAEFEAALAREGGDPAGALRDAVAAYTGDLLEGSYDDWVLDERERLRELLLDALDRLSALLVERGEHAEAIRHAERLVRHDPLREDSYRLLMRLHDARGDRARALRVYHACAAELARELGIEPSEATRAAYEALLPGTEAAAPPGALAGAVLVGRAAERARLAELWRAAEDGRAQLVLVTGEPGIGKTRLVEELRSWCAQRGAVTAEARSYPAEGALAYGPVVSWLRSERLAASRRRLDAGRLAGLARVLPELDVPPVEPLPDAEQRQRLFDALACAIRAPAAPLLLVADDLHWSDPETLQFLHYLIRSDRDAPLLVLATARREELEPGHPLVELMIALRALERGVEVELDRLSRDETAVLAERLTHRALDQRAAERLFAGTEGNPLFVVEALRAGWDGAGGVAISPRVQAVIEARLAQLGEPARELVGVAATVGREFTTDVLARASDGDEAALVGGLDELWRRRIVRDRGPDAYDFTHDTIREVAYRALPPARRRQAHLRVADALARLRPDEPAAVALQYERAGAAESAVSWYERAADAALRVPAGREALRLLDRARRLLATLPEGADRDARELALVTAAVAPLAIVEGYSSLHLQQLQRRGLEVARGLGAEPDAPLLRSLAMTALSGSDFERSRAFAGRLRERAERDADDVLLVESDYVLGISAFWAGQLDAARRHFEAAVERYRPEHRAAHLARYGMDPGVVCLSRLGNTLWFLGRPLEAARARDSALALAEENEHPATVATAAVFAALLAVELRDGDGVREYAALAARFAGRDVKMVQATVPALEGYVDVLDGRADRGVAGIRGALETAQGAGHAPGMRAAIGRLLLEACAIARDARAGVDAAEFLLAPDAGARLWDAEAHRLRAAFRAALGASHEEVGAELERALDVARCQGAGSLERRAAADLLRWRRGTLAERTVREPAGHDRH
jgi:DNA-binding SARP family transcriptional activator